MARFRDKVGRSLEIPLQENVAAAIRPCDADAKTHFDVSRVMVGALGTLGIVLEVSLRVIPMFETEVTLAFEHGSADLAAENLLIEVRQLLANHS